MTLKFITGLVLFMSSSAFASGPVQITCGDHWFAINASVGEGDAKVSFSGDSVNGDAPSFVAAVNQRTDAEGTHVVLTFGETAEQTLSVSFPNGASYGDGIYSESPDANELYINCFR